jgi:hypothetical protein
MGTKNYACCPEVDAHFERAAIADRSTDDTSLPSRSNRPGAKKDPGIGGDRTLMWQKASICERRQQFQNQVCMS